MTTWKHLRKLMARPVVLALVLFAMPFPYYAWSRWTGVLPSEADWWAQGMNHGPWRWQAPMALVIVPMYGLLLAAPTAFVFGAVRSLTQRRWLPLGMSTLQAAIFAGFFYVQAMLLFWTID